MKRFATFCALSVLLLSVLAVSAFAQIDTGYQLNVVATGPTLTTINAAGYNAVAGSGNYGGTGIFADGGGGDSKNGLSDGNGGTFTGGVGSFNGDGIDVFPGTAFAGYFGGDVYVAGNLSKSGGSFKIDHPLDPANKYLYHSFVESPDMMNIYNGNAVTDGNGDAVVPLPEWFETLNRDFRYQLTVIGQFAQAVVTGEVANHQFSIKTDKPAVKVSWQVTGIRQDPWANAHRIPVESKRTPANEVTIFIPNSTARRRRQASPGPAIPK